MVEKYRYYGMTWKFPTFVKYQGYRFKFGGITDPNRAKININEMKFSGKSGIVRVFKKVKKAKNPSYLESRKGKEFKIYVLYWRDTGKRLKTKPFDWNDPENKYKYNMGGGVQRRP